MFEGLKDVIRGLFSGAGAAPTGAVPTGGAPSPEGGGDVASAPKGTLPWEDVTRSAQERLDGYRGFVQSKLLAIHESLTTNKKDLETKERIIRDPDTQHWMAEGDFLEGCTAEQFVERMDREDREAAKKHMGKRMVGPDAKIFEGKDLGEIPALPANIMEILNSKCELSNDGRTVAETHRLVLVPASIDGKPLTLNALRALATEAGKGRDPSFFVRQIWHDNEAFANKPLEKSTWVLEYETVAPKSTNLMDAEQVALVEKLPNHRTAKILEHVGAMVFNDLENGERIYPDIYGRCEERSASGARVRAGNFSANGPYFVGNSDGHRSAYLGRAVVRKLNT